MDLGDLLKFIDLEDKRLRGRLRRKFDEEKHMLARAVKLSEETGELCSEILSFNSLQRQEKLDSHSREKMDEEFADVIITTLLLAKTADTDIKEALKRKIDKINRRYKN
jgi:NTP pyrophosphatase (non-canonical NTP hydrolase)